MRIAQRFNAGTLGAPTLASPAINRWAIIKRPFGAFPIVGAR